MQDKAFTTQSTMAALWPYLQDGEHGVQVWLVLGRVQQVVRQHGLERGIAQLLHAGTAYGGCEDKEHANKPRMQAQGPYQQRSPACICMQACHVE